MFEQQDDKTLHHEDSKNVIQMSHDMRFPTMWYVRPVKAQTSLRIRADWSEPFASRLNILWLLSYLLNIVSSL